MKEAVSDAITHHLSDPRIEGFVSVTRVDMAPDLRGGDVYLSIFGQNEAAQNKTFAAIEHAHVRIQSLLAKRLQSKFCPVLRFHRDDAFKKTIETMNLIDQAVDALDEADAADEDEFVQ